MRILHICENSTFLERAIKLFEGAMPGKNLFLVQADTVHHNKIDFSSYENVFIAPMRSNEYQEVINSAPDNFGLCVFHNIGMPYKKAIARKLKGKIGLHGICWGWEIYDDRSRDNFVYLSNTKARFPIDTGYTKAGRLKGLKNWIKRNIIKRGLKGNKHHEMFEILDSYSTILWVEKDYMVNHYGYQKQHFPFIYGYVFAEDFPEVKLGHSVLVGNSATPSNNHLEMLDSLSKIKHKVDRFIVPLSYGSEDYGKAIADAYIKAFGDKVWALTEFMPFSKYQQVLQNCGFVVMNHLRQQAMGNVFMLLYMGAKVFLNKDSMAYRELKKLGFIIYSHEEMEKEVHALETVENNSHNKRLVIDHRGMEACRNNILRIVDYYNKHAN